MLITDNIVFFLGKSAKLLSSYTLKQIVLVRGRSLHIQDLELCYPKSVIPSALAQMCLGRCFLAAGQDNSIVSSRLLFSLDMGNLYDLLRYSLILGFLSYRINRYVRGGVFIIESCVTPIQ